MSGIFIPKIITTESPFLNYNKSGL